MHWQVLPVRVSSNITQDRFQYLSLGACIATRSALPELLEAAVLPLVEATPGCTALPEFLEAAEEKKLRRAVAGSSALLQLVCRSVLSELLRAAEAGRFMAALEKMQS